MDGPGPRTFVYSWQRPRRAKLCIDMIRLDPHPLPSHPHREEGAVLVQPRDQLPRNGAAQRHSRPLSQITYPSHRSLPPCGTRLVAPKVASWQLAPQRDVRLQDSRRGRLRLDASACHLGYCAGFAHGTVPWKGSTYHTSAAPTPEWSTLALLRALRAFARADATAKRATTRTPRTAPRNNPSVFSLIIFAATLATALTMPRRAPKRSRLRLAHSMAKGVN